jgi:general secretion pathway protein E
MVRRICPFCKIPSEISVEEEAAYVKELGEKPGRVFKGAGCNMCANTGFRGRVALFELLVMNESLRRLVLTGASADLLKQQALKDGMLTVQRDGMLKVKQGITTVAEVIRVLSQPIFKLSKSSEVKEHDISLCSLCGDKRMVSGTIERF